MNRIQLINKNMRLVGVTEEMMGKYVVADDWSVIEVIGESWQGIAYSMKMKAIRVDYVGKIITASYDFKSEMFQNIIKGEKYDPNVGNHWGGEMIVQISINNQPTDMTWFLCTPATREMIKPLNAKLSTVMNVSSVLVDTGRFKFYNPIVTFDKD